MKRFLTISLFALTIFALTSGSAEASEQPYGWTISNSLVTPFSNTGTATEALRTLYLWLACCDLPDGRQQGMSAAAFDIVASGIQLVATVMVNGFLNAGGTSALLMAVGGCPCGELVAANLLTIDLPGSLCIGPSTIDLTGTVDCEPQPTLWGFDWVGYDNTGSPPCAIGSLCDKPISVEDASWGSIKGLYR